MSILEAIIQAISQAFMQMAAALLGAIVQAVCAIATTMLSLVVPVLDVVINLIPEGSWLGYIDGIGPYAMELNIWLPVEEVAGMLVVYWSFLVALAIVRLILKLVPFVG